MRDKHGSKHLGYIALTCLLIFVSPVFAALFDEPIGETPRIFDLSPSEASNDERTTVTITGTFSESAILKTYAADGSFISYIGHDQFKESIENKKTLEFQPQTPVGIYEFSILEQNGKESLERLPLTITQEETSPNNTTSTEPTPKPTVEELPGLPEFTPLPEEAPPIPCSIISITWDEESAKTGEETSVTITTSGLCNKEAKITLLEEDLLGATVIQSKQVRIRGNSMRVTLPLDQGILEREFDSVFEGGQLELRAIIEQLPGPTENQADPEALLETIKEQPSTDPITQDTQSGILFVTKGEDKPQASSTNWITITEKEGKTTKNYPIQIGRMFVQGEIQNYPSVSIEGKLVPTQADVKTRWSDGSVQHAIMTFYIPELKPNQKVTVTFTNQQTGNNDGHLTQQEMLHERFNFGADFSLTSGSNTQKASARAMLAAGDYTHWLKGSEATSIILADHSSNRAYDIGFDQHRSFRPIVHATFFPKSNQVRIRFIGEITNTEVLQDMQYDATLNLGSGFPWQAYQKKGVNHHSASRWTKEYWTGPTPSKIEIDHNVGYLTKTNFFSNYDTSLSIPEWKLAKEYQDAQIAWNKNGKEIMDSGWYYKNMGSGGGRREIGPWPEWSIYWLYTGDNRMKEIALTQANLGGSVPVHFREGKTGRLFATGSSADALGRVLSPVARPTQSIYSGNSWLNNWASNSDKINPVGTYTKGGWNPDCSHQPETYSIQYILTGDYWYLEQLYFWSSWGSFHNHHFSALHGRGPTKVDGSLTSDVRGKAWCIRTRGRTAFLAPDGTPEKLHFTKLLNDFIASFEGALDIKGTTFENTAMWKWGNTVLKSGTGSTIKTERGLWGSSGAGGRTREPPKLGFIEKGNGQIAGGHVKPGNLVTLPWQQNFAIYTFGHLKELGYPTGALLDHSAQFLIGQLTTPGFDPFMSAQYYLASLDITSKSSDFYSTFAQVKEQHDTKRYSEAKSYFRGWLNHDNHGYSYIAFAAAAYITHLPKGKEAWDFLKREVYDSHLNKLYINPKWGILPRDLKGCVDIDNDGYGSAAGNGRILGCRENGIDCNDNDATINPGAKEICNDGKDNDCDSKIDSDDLDCSLNGNPSCNIGPWKKTTPIAFSQGGAHDSASFAHNGWMYLTGGQYGRPGDDVLAVDKIWRAKINGDGTLGNWVEIGKLPAGNQDHRAVLFTHPKGTDTFIYIVGGWTWSPTERTWYAKLNSDGSIGPWKNGPSLNSALHGHDTAIVGDKLYSVGGWTGTQSPFIEYVTLNPDGSMTGSNGKWIRTTNLPKALSFIGSGPNGWEEKKTTKNYVYATGGERMQANECPLTTKDTIYVGEVSSTGTIPSWRETTKLPEPLFDHSLDFTRDTLIMVGGAFRDWTNKHKNPDNKQCPEWIDATIKDTVYLGEIGNDGIITGWKKGSTLPNVRADHSSVMYNDYLYVIGGREQPLDSPYPEEVWYAKVTCDSNQAFNFNIAANPASGSAVQGGYNETIVTVTKLAPGSSGTVDLNTVNLAENLTATFTPSRCVFDTNKNTCTSNLRINVGPRRVPGKATVIIEGTSGTTKKQTTYDLDVRKLPPLDAPKLNAIEPSTISNRVDNDLSFIGTNFTELAALIIGETVLPIPNTIPINDTLVRYLATKGWPAGTYNLQVVNFDLQRSNAVTLTVEDTAATQKVLDTDLDGVPNNVDKCPRTQSKFYQKVTRNNGCPTPDYGSFSRTLTTDFSKIVNPHAVPSLRIGTEKIGQIAFLKEVPIMWSNWNYIRFEPFELTKHIKMAKNKILLDSQNLPTMNVKSQITFYNTTHTNPVPYQDGKRCSTCSVIKFDTKSTDLWLGVEGWSEYEIKQGSCGDGYCSMVETTTSCPADCKKKTGGSGGGGGGSGGGGGGGSPNKQVFLDLDDGKAHSTSITKGLKLQIQVHAKKYLVEVQTITDGIITLKFLNTTKTLAVKELTLYTVDIDGDKTEDIDLYVTKTGNQYSLTLSKVKEKLTDKNEGPNTNKTKQKDKKTDERPQLFNPSKAGFWIILLGITAIIVGTWLLRRKHE